MYAVYSGAHVTASRGDVHIGADAVVPTESGVVWAKSDTALAYGVHESVPDPLVLTRPAGDRPKFHNEHYRKFGLGAEVVAGMVRGDL